MSAAARRAFRARGGPGRFRFGATTRGELAPNAKLDWARARAIRAVRDQPGRPTARVVGARHGVSGATVCAIWAGTAWVE